MINKKIFSLLVVAVLFLGACHFLPVFAAESQNGSMVVDVSGVVNPVTVTLTVSGKNALTGLPLAPKTATLTINPAGAGPVDGSCGPTEVANPCIVGTFSNLADDATHYLWQCLGQNGGADVSCSQNKPSATTASILANGDNESTNISTGDDVTLAWSYTDAGSCQLDPSVAVINIPPNSGNNITTILNVSESKIYSITCDGVTDSVTVNVIGAAATSELHVNKSGQGNVTSDVGGINCGSDCSETYDDGTTVNLTATPSSGRVFTGWSGDCNGKGVCSILINGDKSVTANFAINPGFTEF